MKLKSILLFSAISLLSFAGYSQKTWTLTDCIDYAHANNIQIKRSQLQAEVSQIDKVQSITNTLPSVNGNLGRSYGFGRQVNETTNEFSNNNFFVDNYRVEANVGIFNGLRNFNNMKRSEYASLAALQNVEKEKVEKTIEIASAYLEILYQQELVGVAKSQQSITAMQVERTDKLVQAGSVAKGDLLEMQAQLANENLLVTNANNQMQLSKLNLIQLLDLDSVGGFNIVTPDTIDPQNLTALLPVSDVYQQAMGYLPHIKSAEFQLLSNQKNLMIQKGRFSPSVYVSGSIFTKYSDIASDPINPTLDYQYSDQLSNNLAQSLSVGLSIPIFNRMEVSNDVARARIQVEDSEYQLAQMKQQIYKNIQQAHNNAVSARDKFASATEAVNSYQEAFHYTEQKYNVGIVNSVEYNIAKNNFIKAESELLQAKYEYVFANKILDFYRGVPITL